MKVVLSTEAAVTIYDLVRHILERQSYLERSMREEQVCGKVHTKLEKLFGAISGLEQALDGMGISDLAKLAHATDVPGPILWEFDHVV